MTNQIGENQKRRESLRYREFYFSFLWTLFPTLFFLLGKSYFLFPFNSLTPKFLFPFGNSIHRNTDFFVNIIFSVYEFLFKDKRYRGRTSENKRSLVVKSSRLVVYCLVGLISSWTSIVNSSSFYSSLITTLLSFLFSSFLLEIVLRAIDDYGVCNGSSFIFLIELIPVALFNRIAHSIRLVVHNRDFSTDNLKDFLTLFFLLLFSFLITTLTNIKWESVIESNNFFSRENNIIEDNKFTFGIKMNFSLFSMIEISSLISLFSVLFYVLRRDGIKWNFLLKVFEVLSLPHYLRTFGTDVNSCSFTESFLAINNRSDWIFVNFFENCKQSLFSASSFLPAFSLLITLLHLMSSISNYLFRVRPDDISDDLARRGIYFNKVSIGRGTTRMIIFNVVRIFALWVLSIVSLNFFFDLFISNNFPDFQLLRIPSFINWFTMVTVANDIFQQIRTKYSYLESSL